jgi:putative transposase
MKKRKLKKEDLDKIGDLNLDKVLDEISKINLDCLIKDNYFNYKKYPEQVRKYIYTTNVVENINSRIELIRANTGGYFQSIKTAEVAIYVTVSRIEKNKWKEPLPLVKSALYELKQIFVKKFYEQTQFS